MASASPNPHPASTPRLGRIACVLLIALILAPTTHVSIALTEPTLTPPRGHFGETVFVEGTQGDIGGGLTAVAYWDAVKLWDGARGLLNASIAQPSGYYNITFRVPEAPGGVHRVIVKEQESSLSAYSSFKVVPSIDLRDYVHYGERLTIEGHGFGESAAVAFLLMEYATPSGIDWWPSLEEDGVIIGVGDGEKRVFDFEVTMKPVKPGSATVDDGHETFTDSGNGVLTGSRGGSGVIDYATGKGEVAFDSAPAQAAGIEAAYSHYSGVASIHRIESQPLKANGLGALCGAINVPALPHGDYLLCAIDSVNNTWIKRIHLGPEVEISDQRVDVGDVLRVKCSGFTHGDRFTSDDVRLFSDGWVGENCQILQGSSYVDGYGDASFDIFIPQVPGAGEEYQLQVRDQHQIANTVYLHVDEMATVSATVERLEGYYRVQVAGANFPNRANEKVVISLESRTDPSETYRIAEATTDANGGIDARVVVSTNTYRAYTMTATAEEASIEAETLVQITPLDVELSKYTGPPGDEVVATGTGFTPKMSWEARFGKTLVVSPSAGVVTSKGTIRLVNSIAEFKVPEVPPGTYTVTFTDVVSKSKFETEFQVEEQAKIEGKPPTPVITSPDTVLEGEPTQFSSAGSRDPDGAITQYTWDFGDASGSSQANPAHTYGSQGAYHVRLTVKDSSGLTATASKTVNVEDTEPEPGFTAVNTQGVAPVTVLFRESCRSFDGITSWMWDFGDGQSSPEKNPSHTYSAPGMYTVKLTVHEGDGDSETVIKEDLVRVYYVDRLPPVIHASSAEKIDKNTYLFAAVVTDNQKIVSVKVRSSLAEQQLEIDPENPGLYMARVTGLDPAQCTIVAEDIGGNVYQTHIQSIMTRNVVQMLSPGWNVVQIPNSCARVPVYGTSLLGLALEPLLVARDLNNVSGSLPLPRIEAVWTYDPYRGYLVNSDTGITEFSHYEPGRVYWVKVSEDYPLDSVLSLIM